MTTGADPGFFVRGGGVQTKSMKLLNSDMLHPDDRKIKIFDITKLKWIALRVFLKHYVLHFGQTQV